MTNSVELVDGNPVVLVKEIEKNIRNGFYVTNTIEGYPTLNSFPFRVRLFEGAQPEKRIGLSEESDNIVIESYDAVTWLLDLQDLVLQGFVIDTDSVIVGNLMAATARRPKLAVAAPKAPVEVGTEIKPAKAGRKSKSKEV